MGHDHFMPDDVKKKLQHLTNRVSRYAVDKIKKELANDEKESSSESSACNCSIRVNFGIPCRHVLPLNELVPLSLLHERWLLDPNDFAGA